MSAAWFIYDALLYFIILAVYMSVFINVNGYWNLWTHHKITWQTRTFRTVYIEPQETLRYWWGTHPWPEGGSFMCLVRWSNSQGPFSSTSQLTLLNTHEYGVSFISDGNWEPGLFFPAWWCSVPYIFKRLGTHACILWWRSCDEQRPVGCSISRSVCLWHLPVSSIEPQGLSQPSNTCHIEIKRLRRKWWSFKRGISGFWQWTAWYLLGSVGM